MTRQSGSPRRATGLKVSQEAAESGIVKTLTLELGGKNPIIICDDADLDTAATAVVRGMNFSRVQGQSCGSTSRPHGRGRAGNPALFWKQGLPLPHFLKLLRD